MINEVKMDEVMLELGHTENLLGTGYIRRAVILYDAGAQQITGELYPALAAAVNATPQQVERNIRHSIETAWMRGSSEAQLRWFGYSVNPATGRPTVGEYIARMARICHEN